MKNICLFVILSCVSITLFSQDYCSSPNVTANTLSQTLSNSTLFSPDREFYLSNLETWIPRMNTLPLQNSPLKVIQVNFNILQKSDGSGNYPNSPEGKKLLINNFLDELNNTFTNIIPTSDPFSWVVNLPNNDTRIRFDLGKAGNERIYYYKDDQLYASSNFNDYLNATIMTDPDRAKQLNVYFTESYYMGKIAQKDFSITNKGSGYTTAPQVLAFYNGIRVGTVGKATILNGQVETVIVNETQRYFNLSLRDGLTIKFVGGGGNGATAIALLSQGASGMGTYPNTSNYEQNSVIYMFHHYSGYRSSSTPSNSQGYQLKGVLAHEFGHNLGLYHTFGEEPCSGNLFMTDLYGLTPPGTCPFYTRAENATDANGDRITNNLMNYGDIGTTYVSPMQVGKMHNSLSLSNVSRYVSECHSPIPYIIKKAEIWDWRMRMYQNIILNNGGVLNIKSILTMPVNGKIVANMGSKIVLENDVNSNSSEFWQGIEINDGGIIEIKNTTISNFHIIVRSGGTLKIPSDAIVNINNKGKIELEAGAYICIETGASITLQDYVNVVNLRNGYKIGVNPLVMKLTENCNVSLGTYQTTGNGRINIFNSDIYIQNETFTTNKYLTGFNIFAGSTVTNTKQIGPVLIQNGANVIFDAEKDALLDKGFEVQIGSSFEVK